MEYKWLVGSIGAPLIVLATPSFFMRGVESGAMAAWGQWLGDAIILGAAIFAFRQILLTKNSSETEVFLKICAIIDNEKFLAFSYNLKKHKKIWNNENVLKNGLDKNIHDYESFMINAKEILYQLEKIGILVEYSIVNKKMVCEYVGDVVKESYDILSKFIEYEQKKDQEIWGNFVRLRQICADYGW